MFYMYNSTLLSARSLRISEHGIYISEAMAFKGHKHILFGIRDKRRTLRLVNDAKIHKQNHLCQWQGTAYTQTVRHIPVKFAAGFRASHVH